MSIAEKSLLPVCRLFFALLLITTLSAQSVKAESTQSPSPPPALGPQPYPTSASDWPGEGVIRVFPWMTLNRQAFWRERSSNVGTVVLAGDSLLAGWTSAPTDLQQAALANRGIGGDVSRGLLFRFQEDVVDLQPRAVVLLIGTNDLSAAQDIGATRKNIEAMLDLLNAKTDGVVVILCTLPPRNDAKAPIAQEQLLRLNSEIHKIGRRQPSVKILDLYRIFSDADGNPIKAFFQPDLLHLSKVGYAEFGRNLEPELPKPNSVVR